MPDITMCTNNRCNRRGGCYRYRATPNKYLQSYSKYVGGEDCRMYVAIKDHHSVAMRSMVDFQNRKRNGSDGE